VKATKILCVGGKNTKSVREIYNTLGTPLKKYPDLPHNVSHGCVLKLDDFIYCVGGAVDGHWRKSTNKVYRLNLKDPNSGWQEVASMAEKRRDFGAAVYNGCLVVAGGFYGERLSSTELYQPSLNKWSSIASLNKRRDKLALVVVHAKLYAIGGSDGKFDRLSSVEQLCSVDGKWKEVESMNMQRSHFAAVSCNNFIYAIGGRNNGEILNSVERYDVGSDKWSFVNYMRLKRSGHAACVLLEKIFVLGGTDDKANEVKTIECYDPATYDWKVVDETEEVFGHAIDAI